GSLLRGAFVAAEPLVEDVLEVPRSCSRSLRTGVASSTTACEYVGEVESTEAHVRATAAAGSGTGRRSVFRIVADLIVHLLLLRIAEDVVGFLDLFETVLGGFVTGIEI